MTLQSIPALGVLSSIVHFSDPESLLTWYSYFEFLRKFVSMKLSRLDEANIHYHVEMKAMVDQRVETRVFKNQEDQYLHMVWIYCEGFLSG